MLRSFISKILVFLLFTTPAFAQGIRISSPSQHPLRHQCSALSMVGCGDITSTGLTTATGLLVSTSLQNSALVNCDTIDTDAAGIFECGTDGGGGGATAWDDIADPDADNTIALGGFESTLTSTLDEATHYVLKVDNSDADLANETTLLGLEFTDDADIDGVFIKALDNNGDLMWSLGYNGRMVIGPGATDYALPTARGSQYQVLMDNGAGAVTFQTLSDTNVTDVLTINNASSVTTTGAVHGGSLQTDNQADIEGYAAIGNGSALDASYSLLVDRDFTDTGANSVAQVVIGGQITKTTFAPGLHQSYLEVAPDIEGPVAGMSFTNIAPINVASVTIHEPNITEVGTADVLKAYTLYIESAPTEGGENAALKVDAGDVEFDEDLTVGQLTTATGLIVTTSLQDTALPNCDTIDTNASGILGCGTDGFAVDEVLHLYDAVAVTTDAAGEMAFDTNGWAAGRGATQVNDGTASTYLIGALVSDTPNNGEVPKWSTGGTITWEIDNNTAGITVADTQVIFSDGADNPVGDSGMTYNKITNTLTVGAVETSPNSNPTSSYYDSDTADGDLSTKMATNCTDTGSGTEDCNVTFSQQVAGVMTDVMVLDADFGTRITGTTVAISGLTTMTGLKVTTSLQDTALVSCDTIDTDTAGIFKCGTDSGGGGGGDFMADGSVPMTGTLDMNGEIIDNASRINNTGLSTASGLIVTTSLQNTAFAGCDVVNADVAGILGCSNDFYNTTEIDSLIAGSSFDYFLSNTASIVLDYVMYPNETGEAESSDSNAGLGVGDNQLLATWVTAAGQPTFSTLASGIYDIHIHAARTAGTRTCVLYATLTEYKADTSETLVWTSETSPAVTTKSSFTFHSALNSDYELAASTSRLELKIYANISGGGADDTIVLYSEGTLDSHVSLRSNITALDDKYVDTAGDTMSGLLSSTAGISATGLIVTTSLRYAASASDAVLGTPGDTRLNTLDEQVSFASGSDGEIYGEASISLIRHITAAFDPAGWYDQESTYRSVPLMYVGDDSPEGFTITEWKVKYVGGDPTTEINLDLCCDTTPDFNPAAGMTVMDILDSTNGASTADSGFDSATCANGAYMYLRLGADPQDANVVVSVDVWGFNEED